MVGLCDDDASLSPGGIPPSFLFIIFLRHASRSPEPFTRPAPSQPNHTQVVGPRHDADQLHPRHRIHGHVGQRRHVSAAVRQYDNMGSRAHIGHAALLVLHTSAAMQPFVFPPGLSSPCTLSAPVYLRYAPAA